MIKVKPLEWEGDWGDDVSGLAYYSFHGGYLYFGLTDNETIGTFNNIDEAKSAAQSDYERRILGAIEPEHVNSREDQEFGDGVTVRKE